MDYGAEVKGIINGLRGALELMEASGIQEVPDSRVTLSSLYESARGCSACRLAPGKEGFGFGAGIQDPDILFVASAPFGPEGAGVYSGEPGRLLEKMIRAMGYDPPGVYLAFALKCAPPEGFRAGGLMAEIGSCRGFLFEQIRLLSPRVVVALGSVAAAAVLGDEKGDEKPGQDPPRPVNVAGLRGRVHEREGYALVVTWGPEELVENPELKREAWEDLKLSMGLLKRG